MTFLIVPAPDGTSWTEAYFPGMSPLHLGVVAKSWAEHLLDWCQTQGATAVKILDHFHDEALVRGHLGDGSRWGFRLAYEGAGRFASREDAVRRNRAFAAGDGDVRVVWGPVFPHRGEWTRVDSLRVWFDLNFRVLADPADRTLPGYSSEPGVSIGENVMIKTRADVRRPVALGDNVRIEDGVTLAGDVIVGAGTFVERDCFLRRAVVFSHGYLGRGLSFEEKAVIGARVIDVRTGAFADLDEPGLSTRFRRRERVRLVDAWEWALAVGTAAGLLPLALVLWPWCRSTWAYKLSVTRLPAVLRAVFLRGRLIRLSETDGPCAFRASEALSARRTPEEKRLDDIWYRCSRTPWFATVVVVKGLLNRLCAPAGLPPRDGEEEKWGGGMMGPWADVSFTAAHDAAADAALRAALPEIVAAVRGCALPSFAGLVLGGGYGRGEGGATAAHRLYNDLDLFVFLDAPEAAFPSFAQRLAPVAAAFTARLGVDVDFTLRTAARLRRDGRRLMVQELLRGHVALDPSDFDLAAWSGVRPRAAADLPAGEAARLVMNRGMGLEFARRRLAANGGRADAFVLRNLNKAVLGAGDARLIAEGRYAWRLDAREAALADDAAYAKACAFKRRPPDDAAATSAALPCAALPPTWDEAFAAWRAAAATLFARRGRELRRRSPYQLARWIARRRTLGALATLGQDCTVRVLERIRATLADGVPPDVERDWEVFN